MAHLSPRACEWEWLSGGGPWDGSWALGWARCLWPISWPNLIPEEPNYYSMTAMFGSVGNFSPAHVKRVIIIKIKID